MTPDELFTAMNDVEAFPDYHPLITPTWVYDVGVLDKATHVVLRLFVYDAALLGVGGLDDAFLATADYRESLELEWYLRRPYTLSQEQQTLAAIAIALSEGYLAPEYALPPDLASAAARVVRAWYDEERQALEDEAAAWGPPAPMLLSGKPSPPSPP